MFCFTQTFTLTSRSLHLPVGGQLISSISFEMFGCQPFFFTEALNLVFDFQWSLRFHCPDFIFFSFFASPQKYAALCHSDSHLLFVGAVQVPGLFFT